MYEIGMFLSSIAITLPLYIRSGFLKLYMLYRNPVFFDYFSEIPNTECLNEDKPGMSI